jgi:hypothetical protein
MGAGARRRAEREFDSMVLARNFVAAVRSARGMAPEQTLVA